MNKEDIKNELKELGNDQLDIIVQTLQKALKDKEKERYDNSTDKLLHKYIAMINSRIISFDILDEPFRYYFSVYIDDFQAGKPTQCKVILRLQVTDLDMFAKKLDEQRIELNRNFEKAAKDFFKELVKIPKEDRIKEYDRVRSIYNKYYGDFDSKETCEVFYV